MATRTSPSAKASPTTVAFSYLRYSSAAQSDGDSVRRQTALRQSWLKRHPDVRLDNTLVLEDRGTSAYRGAHRTNRRHALARFLDEVERGRVPQGSYLIVENLDRLTREEFEVAVPAVLALIKAGVKVVQLSPIEVVYEPGMDEGRKLLMIMELSRGHSESQRKSDLVGAAWGEKKRLARESRVPHGKSVPAWLELVDGKYRIRPEAGQTVRRIFQLAAEGQGNIAIAQKLATEGVPPIGRAGVWNKGFVNWLLTNRAAVGEYQPMTGPRGQRVPDGEAVEGYFPRLVSDELWAKVQATRGRRSHPGSRLPRSRHLLAGLVVDARTNSVMYVHKHQTAGPLLVARDAYERRVGAVWGGFPADILAAAILGQLCELKGDELFRDPTAAKVAEVTARLTDVERRLQVAVERFDADPENMTWQTQIDRLDPERRRLVAELTAVRREAASPLPAAWAEATFLMTRDEPERLKAALNRVVEEIRLLVVARPMCKVAVARVHFPGGASRTYIVCRHYHHKTVPQDRRVPWTAKSFALASTLPEDFDLKRAEDVTALEELLGHYDAKRTLSENLEQFGKVIDAAIATKERDLKRLKKLATKGKGGRR